jgi:hypothetical protein
VKLFGMFSGESGVSSGGPVIRAGQPARFAKSVSFDKMLDDGNDLLCGQS